MSVSPFPIVVAAYIVETRDRAKSNGSRVELDDTLRYAQRDRPRVADALSRCRRVRRTVGGALHVGDVAAAGKSPTIRLALLSTVHHTRHSGGRLSSFLRQKIVRRRGEDR